jgi:hypothetical protein
MSGCRASCSLSLRHSPTLSGSQCAEQRARLVSVCSSCGCTTRHATRRPRPTGNRRKSKSAGRSGPCLRFPATPRSSCFREHKHGPNVPFCDCAFATDCRLFVRICDAPVGIGDVFICPSIARVHEIMNGRKFGNHRGRQDEGIEVWLPHRPVKIIECVAQRNPGVDQLSEPTRSVRIEIDLRVKVAARPTDATIASGLCSMIKVRRSCKAILSHYPRRLTLRLYSTAGEAKRARLRVVGGNREHHARLVPQRVGSSCGGDPLSSFKVSPPLGPVAPNW